MAKRRKTDCEESEEKQNLTGLDFQGTLDHGLRPSRLSRQVERRTFFRATWRLCSGFSNSCSPPDRPAHDEHQKTRTRSASAFGEHFTAALYLVKTFSSLSRAIDSSRPEVGISASYVGLRI